jgi:hypothetical protein
LLPILWRILANCGAMNVYHKNQIPDLQHCFPRESLKVQTLSVSDSSLLLLLPPVEKFDDKDKKEN